MNAVAWSPNGKLLAIAASKIDVWDVSQANENKLLTTLGVASSESRKNVTGRTEMEESIMQYSQSQTRRPYAAIAWSPNGELLAAGDSSGRIRVWRMSSDGKTEHGQRTFSCRGQPHDMAWSPDGRQLATIDATGAIHTWRTGEGASLKAPSVE